MHDSCPAVEIFGDGQGVLTPLSGHLGFCGDFVAVPEWPNHGLSSC